MEELNIKEQLEIVEERIVRACQQCGRRREDVHLLAVTKTMPPEVIRAALACGLRDFGESYPQEVREKEELFGYTEQNWHFIGQLQSNKAKYLSHCTLIHSLDSLSAAAELDRHAPGRQRVLIEINCGEVQKGGVNPDEAVSFIRKVQEFKNLQVSGLMTVPPLAATDQEVRRFFAKLAKLRDNIAVELKLGDEFRELSMGMSADFEAAIAEGATWIRLGSILFGARHSAHWWRS